MPAARGLQQRGVPLDRAAAQQGGRARLVDLDDGGVRHLQVDGRRQANGLTQRSLRAAVGVGAAGTG